MAVSFPTEKAETEIAPPVEHRQRRFASLTTFARFVARNCTAREKGACGPLDREKGTCVTVTATFATAKSAASMSIEKNKMLLNVVKCHLRIIVVSCFSFSFAMRASTAIFNKKPYFVRTPGYSQRAEPVQPFVPNDANGYEWEMGPTLIFRDGLGNDPRFMNQKSEALLKKAAEMSAEMSAIADVCRAGDAGYEYDAEEKGNYILRRWLNMQ